MIRRLTSEIIRGVRCGACWLFYGIHPKELICARDLYSLQYTIERRMLWESMLIYGGILLRLAFLFLRSPFARLVLAYKLLKLAQRAMSSRENLSKLLDLCANRNPMSRLARKEFTSIPVPQITPKPGHPHAFAASTRAVARNHITTFARNMGSDVFSIQQSVSDQMMNVKGCRDYYWPRDVQTVPKFDQPDVSDVLMLIDVDYYLDMPNWLLQYENIVALYTIVPESVAYTDPEHSMTFDKDHNIVVKATTGATYRHRLWNYKHDVLDVCATRLIDYFTLKITAITYQVEIKWIAPQRCIILLIPIAYWRSLAGLLCSFLTSQPLQRLKVAEGDFLRLDVVSNNGPNAHLRSTGRVDEYHCATLPVHKDTTLASMARTSGVKLSIAQIQSFLFDPSVPLDGDKRSQCAALLEYHNSKRNEVPDTVFPVRYSVNNYQFNPGNYDPEAKTSVVPYMTPFLKGCYAPVRTKDNELAAVKGRVTNVKTVVSMTPFLEECMTDFLHRLIPDPNYLDPVDYDEVYARQNRPSQRRILDSASNSSWMKRVFKVFLKAETYDEPKDPRLITTINALDKDKYSRYLYALSDVFVNFTWYAFGKTPISIAAIVADVCQNAKRFVDTSDASRWDGHVNQVCRTFELRMLLRFFRENYAAEIADLHGSQYGKKAYTTEGVTYESEYIRGSGSPETALFNSALMCFLGYLGHRLAGSSDPEAWDRLGVYGGDDAINKDVDFEHLDRAFKMMGQVLKSTQVLRGNTGVNFLGRYYGPEVWNGSTNSCCDIKRQLLKFHTTVNITGYTPVEKLVEKSLAFYMTDAETPIIGPFVNKVLALADVNPDYADPTAFKKEIVPYYSRYTREEQFPNKYEPWMSDLLTTMVPNVSVLDFQAWLNKVNSLEELLWTPLISNDDDATPPPSEPVVVNGEIVHPKSVSFKAGSNAAEKEKKEKSQRPAFEKKSILKGQLTRTGVVNHAETGPPVNASHSPFKVELKTKKHRKRPKKKAAPKIPASDAVKGVVAKK